MTDPSSNGLVPPTRLFELLWPSQVYDDAFLSLSASKVIRQDFKVIGFFHVNDHADLLAEAATMPDHNLWMSVSAVGFVERGRRGSETDVRYVPGLWADLDFKNAPEIDLGEVLRTLPIPPPLLVNSGHGYQPYWPFPEPFKIESPQDRARIKTLNEGLRLWLGDLAGGATFDNVSNLDRILRVPGTFNFKDTTPLPVTILWAGDWRYTIEHLEATVPQRGRHDASASTDKRSNGDRLDFNRWRSEGTTIESNQRNKHLLRGIGWMREQGWHIEEAGAEAWRVAQTYPTTDSKEPWDENYVLALVDDIYGRYASGTPTEEEWQWAHRLVTQMTSDYDAESSWLDNYEHHSDDGNALLFVRQHLDAVRYAVDAKAWYVWDETRWVPNAEQRVLDLARVTARTVGLLAALVGNDDVRAVALKHAKASLGSAKIHAIPTLATSDAKLAIRASEFDRDPWLLNTPSGTVHLLTGHVHDNNRDDLCAKSTGVGYDPEATCDYWLDWLRWASNGRPDWVEHLQRAAGYALTGLTSAQVLWLFYGIGANGKSTWLTVIRRVMGDYAWHADVNLLLPRRAGQSTNDVADLMGKRFVVATETREGQRLDERMVKQLTGQDAVTSRHLYENNVMFEPTHKLYLAFNHPPRVTDTSYAFWRRVLMVPWDAVVPEGQKRPDIAEWIVEHEGPGVLRWMIEGCRKWRQDGLKVPECVTERTKAYQWDEDALGRFLHDHLDPSPDGFVPCDLLHRAYEQWCEHEQLSKNLGRTKFLHEVETRLEVGRTRRRFTVGNVEMRPWGYAGFNLTLDEPL